MNRRFALFGVIVLLLIVAGISYAASNGFSLDWWTVDGGGGTSQGGDFAVSGTIGQPDTSSLMSGGEYTVVGGFWSGASTPPSLNLVFLPFVTQ